MSGPAEFIGQECSPQTIMRRSISWNRRGRFVIRGVAPGDYKAFSWQTLEPFRYFDSDFIRESDDRGSAVHVTETSGFTANVTLIP